MKYCLLVLVVFGLLSCNSPESQPSSGQVVKSIVGEAQGTTYTIKYLGDKKGLKDGIDSLLDVIDRSMSNWLPSSAISRFNSGEDSVYIDQHFIRNLTLSKIMNRETNGAFNPMVKPLMDYYGMGSKWKNPESIDSNHIRQLVSSMDLDNIRFKKGNRVLSIDGYMLSSTRADSLLMFRTDSAAQLDFNAVAQGYSVDLIAQHLNLNGIENYLVELGGEMLAKGQKENGNPWSIGIDHPEAELSERKYRAVLPLNNKALATSGNYRKFVEIEGVKYHHTIDPNTGFPARHQLLSATVLATTCATADALATSFMVMGLDKSIDYLKNHQNGVEVVLIYSDQEGTMKYFISKGLRNLVEVKN